jgi:hypothetical protein
MLYIIVIYVVIYMLYILFPPIPIVRYIKTIESHPRLIAQFSEDDDGFLGGT